MLMLDAILAFAVTMLVLATMGSMLVEMFVRAIGKRERGLRVMLESFIETELADLLSAGTESAKELVEKVVHNYVAPSQQARIFRRWPLRIWFERGKSLRRMSKTEFLRRFGQTELGLSLVRDPEVDLASAAARISMKFEEYGNAATELFRREAQTLSAISGILLAFVINVDGLLLFNTYMESDEVRAQVIAESGALQKDVEGLSVAMDEIAAEGAEGVGSIKDDVVQVSEQLEELQGILTARGIPIGYDYLPPEVCHAGDPLPEGFACDAALHVHAGDGDWWFWVLRVLATGFLIGLGGPFWFDAVRNLGRISQVLGRGASVQNKPGADPEASPVTRPEREGIEGKAELEASTAALVPAGRVVEALEAKKATSAWGAFQAEPNDDTSAEFRRARRALARKELRILRSMEDLWLGAR